MKSGREDYRIEGSEDLSLPSPVPGHAILGEETEDQRDATPFSPRCVKDEIEESLFHHRRDLLTTLDMVFFDHTSLYFEGEGGEPWEREVFSRTSGPTLNQIGRGRRSGRCGQSRVLRDVAGNTADVKNHLPVMGSVERAVLCGRVLSCPPTGAW